MNPLDKIWTRFRNIQAVQFKSESRTGIGWSGAGQGVVKVSESHSGVLLFEESGYWRQQEGKELRFTNVFRWTQAEEALRLEHLRFGPDNPVFLFDMKPNENEVWQEINPHPCSGDCYRATLWAEDERLFMRWKVQGAKRDEVISYIYF